MNPTLHHTFLFLPISVHHCAEPMIAFESRVPRSPCVFMRVEYQCSAQGTKFIEVCLVDDFSFIINQPVHYSISIWLSWLVDLPNVLHINVFSFSMKNVVHIILSFVFSWHFKKSIMLRKFEKSLSNPFIFDLGPYLINEGILDFYLKCQVADARQVFFSIIVSLEMSFFIFKELLLKLFYLLYVFFNDFWDIILMWAYCLFNLRYSVVNSFLIFLHLNQVLNDLSAKGFLTQSVFYTSDWCFRCTSKKL